MTDKPGRNDPCPCGSGKKYKQCCLKNEPKSGIHRKFKAVWVNKPSQEVNLMERAFGSAISETPEKTPSFLTPPPVKASSTESSDGGANS
jgi:hypothetical protein